MGQPTVCQQLFNNLFVVGLPNKFLWSQETQERLFAEIKELISKISSFSNEEDFIAEVGVVLMKGNEAISHAAVRCGCDGYFGYPITPQSEVLETLDRVS